MPPARRRPSSRKRGSRPPAGPQRRTSGRAPGTRTPPAAAQPGSTRAQFEQRSAAPLLYLTQLPRWVPFAIVLALAVVAIFVSGPIGAAALVLVAVFLAWLGYLAWPALTSSGRLLRVVSIGVILAAAVLTLR